MSNRWLTKNDFEKAKKALEEAHIPGPHKAYYNDAEYEWVVPNKK